MDCTITFSRMDDRAARIRPKKIAATAIGIAVSIPDPARSAI